MKQGELASMAQFSVCNDPLFDVEHRTDLGEGLVDVRMGTSLLRVVVKMALNASHKPFMSELIQIAN